MQEASHHGRVIREYREQQAGMTQEGLAQRIGKSRRTVVSLEQTARIDDVKLRRTLALALEIPPQLLGVQELSVPSMAVLTAIEVPVDDTARTLSRMMLDTFLSNLRMRFDLYYLSALGADRGLNAHINDLSKLAQKSSFKDRHKLLILLSHNYQLKGMIARDQLDYDVAEQCFKQASLLAQEAECAELDALSMARRANMYVWRKELDIADQLYEASREISRRSPPSLRAYLTTAHAEVQGMLGNEECLKSLTVARGLIRRIDPEDDPLLLLCSTRSSEQAINDGWAQCHVFLGKPDVALEYYDEAEQLLDLTLMRRRARLYIQYARALYVSKDMSCCFYATEGLKLAKLVGSQYNIRQARDLAAELSNRFPGDERVKELLRGL